MTKEDLKSRRRYAKAYIAGLGISVLAFLTSVFTGVALNADSKKIKNETLDEFKNTEYYKQEVISYEEENQAKLNNGQLSYDEMIKANTEFKNDENALQLIDSSEDEKAKQGILKSDAQKDKGDSAYYLLIPSGVLSGMFLGALFFMGSDDFQENDREVECWIRQQNESKKVLDKPDEELDESEFGAGC